MTLDQITRAVCHDLLAFPIPPRLSREEFVAKYFPQYVEPYRISHALHLRPDGRPTRPNPGTWRAQITKRETKISAAYARYCELHQSQAEFDARSGVSAS